MTDPNVNHPHSDGIREKIVFHGLLGNIYALKVQEYCQSFSAWSVYEAMLTMTVPAENFIQSQMNRMWRRQRMAALNQKVAKSTNELGIYETMAVTRHCLFGPSERTNLVP